MEKTALVLSGGGARGSYEIGVWEGLEELGIHADIVTGSSVGTLNGAMYAQGELSRAKELWGELTTDMVFRMEPQKEQGDSPVFLKRAVRSFFQEIIKNGGLDSSPLRTLLQERIDERRVRESSVELGMVTVETGERVQPRELFLEDIPEGRLIDYLLASCSLYPAIRPYEIDGVPHVDGGYHDNLPVRMAVKRGARNIIAVDLETVGFVRWGLIRRLADVKIVRSHWKLGSLLQLDPACARRNMRLGYLDTLKRFEARDGYAFTFEKGSADLITGRFGNLAKLAQELGFPPDGASLPRLAFSRLERYFGLEQDEEITEEMFCVACAELAGELFGLDCEKIYSVAEYDAALFEAARDKKLPGTAENRSNPLWGGVEFVRELALLRDGGVRVLLMERQLSELRQSEKPLGGPAFAAVLRNEFLAALYLLTAGITQEVKDA